MSQTNNSKVKQPTERHQLKMSQIFAVGKWLDNRVKNADWEMVTYPSLAEEATTELKYTVTVCNIKQVMKANEIPLPRRVKLKSIQGASNKNASRMQIVRLHRALCDLYRELGKEVPEYLNWKTETVD